MTLDGRDRAVVQLVARFKQLSAAHIHQLLFSNLASRTPCDRALRRLTTDGYLGRIERRMVGGSHGGSGQYVYQLGRRGYYMFFEGRYNAARVVNYHSLAIADCYVVVWQLRKAGRLKVRGFSTEPDCWAKFGSLELKPDMYLDVERANGQQLKLWLEVDMGTEFQRQLKGKLEAYWKAFNTADPAQWPVFPITVWVGIDEERAKELAWLIEQGPKDAQRLFRVCTGDTLAELLG